jgi:lysyl-tRNA synthetase class 2
MPSSVIESFLYDAQTQELSVTFRSGRRYIYKDVPRETAEGLSAAASAGEFFNTHIRDQFSFERGKFDTPSS